MNRRCECFGEENRDFKSQTCSSSSEADLLWSLRKSSRERKKLSLFEHLCFGDWELFAIWDLEVDFLFSGINLFE